ncbi:MAG: ABC transporter substrate-binding protein [Chloroflexota bacterium]|nr:MAG: 4-phytase [Chloroflexota bacterium]
MIPLKAPHASRTQLLISLVFVACILLSTSVLRAQETGGVLRVGMNAPVVLDPALHANDSETAFNRAIYDYLIDIEPDGSIAPNLATEWEISDDNLTYTFTLREGVTFHDGKPFSSADVVFTFNRLKEVGSPATGLLGEFEVSAPDANTVVFTLSEVNADFLYGIGSRWALILPEGQNEPNVLAEGSDNPYENFNGTGPFVLQEYSPENRSVFAANENYWLEGEPQLAGMEHIYIADAVAQVDALLSGELDFIFRVPSTQLARVDSGDNVDVLQVPTAQHATIRIRTDEGPGVEVAVRQALKYATDRELLNELLLDGRGIIGNNDPIGPVFAAYYADDIENQPYDPARACELLAEAGYPEGLDMTLYVPNAFEYPDLATILQQQWAEACITIDIQVREENLYYDVSNAENYFDVQLGITGWGSRPIPQQYLQEAYASDAPYNETRWSDPELDELIAEARVTTDEAARREVYHRISEIFAERGPIIVPYFAPMNGAVRKGVEGLQMDPYPGLTDYRGVSITES